MKKHSKEIILTTYILACTVCIFGCRKTEISDIEEIPDVVMEQEDEQEKGNDNKTYFYEKAEEQGVTQKETETYWERLLADDVFQDGAMELTGLVIDDMDKNGQSDLLVMVIEREEKPFYGSGCVWLYMNEDEPYCFADEDASYYGWFDSFAADIDNDGNVEIVLSTQGSGCGAVGDSYKAVLKYRNHGFERMELPSDLPEEYDKGIDIMVYQEPEENYYSAYCDYLKENIYFRAENTFEPEREAVCVGGNVRGFYNLRPVKYEGKNALQASEYLHGEGGIVDNVATAQFIILWDENGNAYIDKWWIEEEENYYANPQGNRITYADGYYYYASQLDNYFLYRVKEDGSDAKCLAKVHSGTILADGDVLYFVNLSDDKAIYRIGTDGSDMKKICDNSDYNIQMSAEYIYFRDSDKSLYRIRKDGSGKELLLKDVYDYMLAAANGTKVMYDGYIYCDRYQQTEENNAKWQTAVTRYDLDGENEEEICCFNFDGDIMVDGDRIYCYTDYGENEGKIGVYTIWKKEMEYLPDEKVTDYCAYKGTLYGIREDKVEESRLTKVYRMEYCDEPQWEEIYCNDVDCTTSSGYYYRGNLTDIYATEQGVFIRQFVSSEEGVKWFSLEGNETIEIWEDENVIPITKQASMMEYPGEYLSVILTFQSTDGYEKYLGEDLTYEEYYRIDEEGKGHNPYSIRLPQFNEKIEGYREINAYFQNVYEEALGDMQEFFAMLDEEKETHGDDIERQNWNHDISYDYVYIGEKYINVGKRYRHNYWGDIRTWNAKKSVTFERKTGRVVTLEEFFGDEPGEAVARVTASVYKYMENGDGYGAKFFLEDYDTLTAKFDPEDFFLFPEGIGIYYARYAIDCGAAGDYLFIVPYPD